MHHRSTTHRTKPPAHNATVTSRETSDPSIVVQVRNTEVICPICNKISLHIQCRHDFSFHSLQAVVCEIVILHHSCPSKNPHNYSIHLENLSESVEINLQPFMAYKPSMGSHTNENPAKITDTEHCSSPVLSIYITTKSNFTTEAQHFYCPACSVWSSRPTCS